MIHAAPEHEFEAAYGLPEALPADERILWQGSPNWQTLARTAFHVRMLAVYFALILALRGAFSLADGNSALAALMSALVLSPLAILAIGTMALMAWFTARTAAYTITNKRVVMRVGVVLSITFNIPFRAIESAGLATFADGSGDLTLTLAGQDQIAYIHLWPHARPWKIARTQPMLRSIPDAARVGAILAKAIAAAPAGSVLVTEAASSGPGKHHATPGLNPAY
jgi:hypothetical protein